jgi:hypothetical protein
MVGGMPDELPPVPAHARLPTVGGRKSAQRLVLQIDREGRT